MFYLMIWQVLMSLLIAFFAEELNIDMPTWGLILVSQVLVFFLPSIVAILKNRKNIRDILPMQKLGIKNIIMILAMTLTIQPIVMVISATFASFFGNDIGEIVAGIQQDTNLWITLAIVAIVPSIFEELALRGVVYSGYKKIDIKKAAVINGLFFAMVHMNLQQFLYAFILGALFCYFVYYTKSIWSAIWAHFALNASQVMLMALFPGNNIDEQYIGQEILEAGMQNLHLIVSIIFISIIVLGFLALFIGIYIAFKNYNSIRNLQLATDKDIAKEDEDNNQNEKVITLGFWGSTIIFVAIMGLFWLAQTNLI